MLSNFWPVDITLGQRTYRTVEHAFQAAKIALVDPALAEPSHWRAALTRRGAMVERHVGTASSSCSTTSSCASGTDASTR
jgi:predicted NAD-dependent protein-ADP-ribosyltransferase YbiA (DUF1768 family)